MRPGPRARLAALVLTIGVAFTVVALSGSLSTTRVRGWVDGFGVAGPLVFLALAVALSLAFVPGPIFAGAAGLLFGTALGTPVALVSALLAACSAFSISRRTAPDAARELGGERVRRLAERIERQGFVAILLLRVAPGVPYMAVNYGAGLTRLALPIFAAATLLGTAPRTFAYVALGGSFGDFGRPETIVAIAILVVMAVGGLVLARRTARQPPPSSPASPPVRSR